jgi:ParB family chromosome partitioning protein
MNVSLVPIGKIITDKNNPRTDITPGSLTDLVASIKAHGIKVPLIGYATPTGVMLCEGHRRLAAAALAFHEELPVIIHPSKPSEAEILCDQLTINGHRAALNPIDEYQAFTRLQQLKGWSPSELATGLAISASEVTRVLSLGKLSAPELKLVREGKLSKSSAYALSRMPPEQRAAMLPKIASGDVTRDQLNRRAKRPGKAEGSKLRRVSFGVPGGLVTVRCEDGLTVKNCIELFDGLVRECRKLHSQNLDIKTAARVTRDKCRAQPAA